MFQGIRRKGKFHHCKTTAGKLERDLIRNRDWNYSGAAFGLTPEACEELRRKVVAEYGESLELIAPSKKSSKKKQANAIEREESNWLFGHR